MKIKEVIEKTKLTDRAIRLYIENGLVAPDIDESYSGRKSIEFSEKDIEKLKKVALLRKADFSIADIKLLFDDNAEIKEIISQYISCNEKDIQNKARIITKLKSISEKNSLSVDDICSALSCELAEANIPKEDLNSTSAEIKLLKFEKGFAVFNIIASVIALALILIFYKIQFRFPQFVSGGEALLLFFNSGWIIDIILSSIILFFNKRYSKKLNKTKDVLTIFIIVIAILSFLSSAISTLTPPVYSVTTNPDNYLKLDSWVEECYIDEIKELFPEEIPSSAIVSEDGIYENEYPFSTRYFYRYDAFMDVCFDIVAQWSLSEEEYIKAKENSLKNIDFSEKKGEWICSYLNNGNDCVRIFAYNDKNKAVRYIASYGINGEYYFLNLDW